MTMAVQLSLQRRSRTASLTRQRAAMVAEDFSCEIGVNQTRIYAIL